MSKREPLEGEGRKPKLALIAGPTASGKSDLAVQLALEAGRRGARAVVINADSAQVYRDLAVLSARPSEAEMQGVPHRLFGTWDGARACSAADWAAAAKTEIAEAHGEGALPVAEAYAELECTDPGRAAALSPNDSARVARALEVVRSTGRPLAHWQARRSGGIGDQVDLAALVLLPDREWLYERCDRRFAAMLEGGAVVEVEALLARGLDPALPVMHAIGVPEIVAMLGGALSRDEALAHGRQATRNYAKRQYTWFRHQPPQSWKRSATIDNRIEANFASLFQD